MMLCQVMVAAALSVAVSGAEIVARCEIVGCKDVSDEPAHQYDGAAAGI